MCVCEDNGAVILSLSFLLSPRCRVMKDSSLLQRDGFSYKTAESEEKRERDENKKENSREASVVMQRCWCEAQWTTVIVLIVVTHRSHFQEPERAHGSHPEH